MPPAPAPGPAPPLCQCSPQEKKYACAPIIPKKHREKALKTGGFPLAIEIVFLYNK